MKVPLDFRTKAGARLRALRHDKGFSQSRVAEILNVSRSYVSDLEHGKNNPNFYLMVRLCQLYDSPVDFVSSGQGLNRVLLDPIQRLKHKNRA